MTPGAKFVLFCFLALICAMLACAQPVNPDVTPATIKQTICVPNWTAKVRPPASLTDKIKRAEMDRAGIAWQNASALELDHRVPLALGGAPRDPQNLWLQSWAPQAPEGWKVDADAHGKDHLERRLQEAVCRGELDLHEAQACIWNDWRACAAKYPAAK